MLEIEQTVIKKALAMLIAAKCQFAVKTPDGVVHGDLKIVQDPPPRTRARSRLPLGTLSNHVRQYIGELQPNQAAKVPALEGATLEALQSSVTAYAAHRWGPGTYMSGVTTDRMGVEILRLP